MSVAIYTALVKDESLSIGWLWGYKMKKYLSFLIGLFFVMFMSSYCFADSSGVGLYAEGGHHHKTTEETDGNLRLSGELKDGIRVIEVKASKYRFEPVTIVVKLGEKVILLVTSIDVAHGLAIPEFKVNLSVPVGKTESIEFVADKIGRFHAHCNMYCG